MRNPLDWSLLSGGLPVALTILGIAALALLVFRAGLRIVLPAALGSAAVAVAVKYIVDRVWRPFPDPLPWAVVLWIGVLLLALTIAAARRRMLPLLAVVPVLALCALQINSFFAYYPTSRAALGLQTRTSPLPPGGRPLVTAPPGTALADVWQAPAGLPARGSLSSVAIPGTVSGFRARPGLVYVPPAYLTEPRAQLPVLILLAGQPGEPMNWITSGQVPAMIDAFAAAHRGLAPIVVIPDDLGSTLANPLCVDSKLGNVETYLKTDVPQWIAGNLQSAGVKAIGGFSHGGTCALQLAVRAPDVYPVFLDISGQREPTLGSRAETVARAFGGDAAAFAAVNPLDVLKTKQFTASAGTFVVGSGDHEYLPQMREAFAAAKAAGMDVRFQELPGGHDWSVWHPALERNLPWLAGRSGITRATP
ncbi:alpha/beta hydrolase [Longispora albida]|uniref:alpha/beta hydrolase n=1 Tax=Longispora albida TaxID=203523 RepID=UPI0003779D8A|nr:alpha/beta hydrolase-fold protein [Longispora albida]